jgi:hypothetical protein
MTETSLNPLAFRNSSRQSAFLTSLGFPDLSFSSAGRRNSGKGTKLNLHIDHFISEGIDPFGDFIHPIHRDLLCKGDDITAFGKKQELAWTIHKKCRYFFYFSNI